MIIMNKKRDVASNYKKGSLVMPLRFYFIFILFLLIFIMIFT